MLCKLITRINMHIFFGGWYRFFVGFNAPKQFLLFFRELQLYETTEATLRVPNLSTKTLSNLFLTVNSKLYKLNLCFSISLSTGLQKGKKRLGKNRTIKRFSVHWCKHDRYFTRPWSSEKAMDSRKKSIVANSIRWGSLQTTVIFNYAKRLFYYV